MKILVIDIETTDLSPNKGGICEIGMTELDLVTGARKKVFDQIVNDNLTSTHKKAWIFQHTNLEYQTVKSAPKLAFFRDEIQSIFNQYKGNVTAWNQEFDFSFFIARDFKISTRLSCPMKASVNFFKLSWNDYYKTYKWPKAQEAWDELFPDSQRTESHRAYDDTDFESQIIFELENRGVLGFKERLGGV